MAERNKFNQETLQSVWEDTNVRLNYIMYQKEGRKKFFKIVKTLRTTDYMALKFSKKLINFSLRE